jgi:hypothetical protein
MERIDCVLVRWRDEFDWGGPEILGRTCDPDLVELVKERIAAARRRELARLEGPVRLVESQQPGAK